MFLLFDLSVHDGIKLVLFDKTSLYQKEFANPNRDLVFCIDKVLKVKKVKKEQISGIMVLVGEGGFTSTRIATTVANAFAFVLQIPLLAINKKQAANPQKLISKLLKQLAGYYISATYSGEANITKPKVHKVYKV